MGGLKKRKALKRLKRRQDAWPGEMVLQNPGKHGPTLHAMHKPGSLRK